MSTYVNIRPAEEGIHQSSIRLLFQALLTSMDPGELFDLDRAIGYRSFLVDLYDGLLIFRFSFHLFGCLKWIIQSGSIDLILRIPSIYDGVITVPMPLPCCSHSPCRLTCIILRDLQAKDSCCGRIHHGLSRNRKTFRVKFGEMEEVRWPREGSLYTYRKFACRCHRKWAGWTGP